MRRSVRGVEIDCAELSDPGLDPSKSVNEDASVFAETPHGLLALVCDGMGGHVSGREASQLATRTIVDELLGGSPVSAGSPEQALESAIRAAGRAVYALGGSGALEARPGSTCVALLIDEQGAVIAHVGDSRALLVREQKVIRLTRDHSMVQQFVDAGLLTPEQALQHPDANKITRALGIKPEVEVELRAGRLALQRDDLLVLASDGLTDLVDDADLRTQVQQRLALGPEALCQELVELAHRRGAHDNITVQLIHVLEVPHRAADESGGNPAKGDGPTNPPEGIHRVAPTVLANAPEPGHVSPTILDDGAWPPRTTQPDLGALAVHALQAAPSAIFSGPRPRVAQTQPPSKRVPLGVALAALVFALLLLAGLAVAGLRALRYVQTHDIAPTPLLEEPDGSTPDRSRSTVAPSGAPAPRNLARDAGG